MPERPDDERDYEAPVPGGEEPDQPTAAPGGEATAESEAEAALTSGAAVESARAAAEPDGGAADGEGRSKSAAVLIAGGILLSRLIGFVRERATAFFFGVGPHADVFRVALRAPNLLQNLLGEGTISAAFIPIYSKMLEEGRPEDAGRFAGAVFGLLVALVAVLVGLGVLLADPITTVLVPGWTNDAEAVAAGELAINRKAILVRAVLITFPMTGLLVLSAWALGVLNSHRQFFLPYFAPVLWNAAIIGALILASTALIELPLDAIEGAPPEALTRLLFAGLLGALAGGLLQFGVQLPAVARVIKGFRISFSTQVEGVKQSFKAFGPVVAGRGVYQLSGYLDIFLAGFIAAGAVSALTYAQVLYTLPISLFGMSVAASELPELSRISQARLEEFLGRVDRSLRQILFMIVPTVVGYLLFGVLVVGALYQTGAFDPAATWQVYFVLAAYTLGLAATTASRLLQNAFYALHDTKTPAKIAVARVAVSAAIGAALMFALDPLGVQDVLPFAAEREGDPLYLGAVGLALGASAGAWVELALLVRVLRQRAEGFGLPWGRALRMAGLALAAAVPAALVWGVLPAEGLHIALRGALVVGAYGVAYLAGGHVLGFEEEEAWTGKLLRRLRRG